MDFSQVYIPDPQKWEKYYNDLLNQRQKEYKDGQSFISPDQFLVSKQISKSDIQQRT